MVYPHILIVQTDQSWPGCSKLTTLLVNALLKFQTLISENITVQSTLVIFGYLE